MTTKQLKPHLIAAAAEGMEIDKQTHGGYWYVRPETLESTCEELCKAGKLARGRKVWTIDRKGYHHSYFTYVKP
ncbi:MAG: hypothetical protein E6Q97_04845 [Desulfurellales bacterium]|mgnify:CR=1 FL=1|jgi:hypothetical protein|nr:MAG: hypothetical protein E6Q97_04845 [Desulfurellales bacterium]